ncbi:MAG: recombination-associated protein RdgC [Aquabacterium sp.]
MFKNLTVYRIGSEWATTAAEIETELEKARFAPCGASQEKSIGWLEPRGIDHGPLVEVVDGHILLKLMVEQKVVPSSVVKRRCDEIAAQIEKQTGRKPGKKQVKELKEQALHELLPMAFTKQAVTRVWIAPRERMLIVDTGSQSRAEEVVTLLVQAIPGFAVSLIQTEMSPQVAMAHWLGTGEAPYAFTIDRECELKSTDEMKSVVRYARHPLDTEEVRQHIVSGKVPTKVAMTWRDRVSFLFTESLQLRKIAFLDVVFEGTSAASAKQDKAEAFDADAAIATGELVELIPELLEALGGELAPGSMSQGTAVPDVARSSSVQDSVAASEAAEAPPWA